MSAFICNHSHITALAVYAARNRILGLTDANLIGAMLHAENVRLYLRGTDAFIGPIPPRLPLNPPPAKPEGPP